MAKKIIIGVVAALALLVLAGFLMPAQVHVERSVVINAPPAQIFPHLCDFEASAKWSPWLERDPNVQNTYSGAPCTTEHKNSWTSEKPDVGNGSQWIAGIEKDVKVDTKLDFGEQGTADATFLLAPEGQATRVTWSFDADMGNNPIARWMGLMMDGWIGPDYEKGLRKLKTVVEG